MDNENFYIIDRRWLGDDAANAIESVCNALGCAMIEDAIVIERSSPEFDAVIKMIADRREKESKENQCYSCKESLNRASPVSCRNPDHIPF